MQAAPAARAHLRLQRLQPGVGASVRVWEGYRCEALQVRVGLLLAQACRHSRRQRGRQRGREAALQSSTGTTSHYSCSGRAATAARYQPRLRAGQRRLPSRRPALLRAVHTSVEHSSQALTRPVLDQLFFRLQAQQRGEHARRRQRPPKRVLQGRGGVRGSAKQCMAAPAASTAASEGSVNNQTLLLASSSCQHPPQKRP